MNLKKTCEVEESALMQDYLGLELYILPSCKYAFI
jgi:hypothetical protein